jgi:tRNA dimethylallyltransferase
MTDPLPGPVVAVVGPTGVGKTEVGEEVAVRLGGEVVSCDSMQVYRSMDIGTSKRPVEERRVRYHCLDIVDPGTPYSAAQYQSDARSAIDSILSRSATPVLVGGTGLYLRAALDDMVFPLGEALTPARRRIERLAEVLGPKGLHSLLADRDPASAAVIHPNNVRRVVRALEMLEEDGVSYAAQSSSFARRRSVYRSVIIGLTKERSALNAAIDARVDAMVERGLVEEVRLLIQRGYRDALTAGQAIGYKELVPYLEGTRDLPDAVESIKLATRRYAKRQMTWFRADPRIDWIDVTRLSSAQAAEAAWALVQSGMRA